MKRSIRRRFGLAAAGILAALVARGPAALADRGAIVTKGAVNIEEPAQRAIIAHNGARELLILQTDVKADRETKVVEFMPLPSKPEVSLAPEGCFAAMREILKAHQVIYWMQYRSGGAVASPAAEGVTVVVAEQLGPHAVTVVEVRDQDEFIRWVREFFRKNALGDPNLGEELREVVSGYLERGIRFFAFDIVTLSPETRTVRPLAYEFQTDHLYYPLVVTSLYGGSDRIELLTIRPRGLALQGERTTSYQSTFGFRRSTAAFLGPEEMARLHPRIPELLGNEPGLLRSYKREGKGLRFTNDVNVPLSRTEPEATCGRFFRALETGDAVSLEILAGDVAVLDIRIEPEHGRTDVDRF